MWLETLANPLWRKQDLLHNFTYIPESLQLWERSLRQTRTLVSKLCKEEKKELLTLTVSNVITCSLKPDINLNVNHNVSPQHNTF